MLQFQPKHQSIGDYLRDRLGCEFVEAKPNWDDNSLRLVFDRWEHYQAAIGKAAEIGPKVRRVLNLGVLDLVFQPPRKVDYEKAWRLGAYPTVEFGDWDKYEWNHPDCDREPDSFSLLC